MEGIDDDLAHLSEVWKATNNQDRVLAENNQRGIASREYPPGSYTPGIEAGSAEFTEWYSDTLLGALRLR